MISRMRRPKVAFELKIDKGPFYPGDELNVELNLRPRQNAEVRGGMVEIICIETYWQQIRRYVYSRYGGYYRTRLYRFNNILFKDSKPFIEATELRAEMPVRKRVTFALPSEALPTVIGGAVNIQWSLKASVDVAKRRDLHEQADLVVSTPQPPAGSDLTARAEATFDHGTMSITMPSDPVRVGETIQGTLRLQIRERLSPRQVRVELERGELAGHRGWSGLFDQQVLEDGPTFDAGQVREWRYRLQVPSGPWPTIETNRSRVEWRVRGVLDIRAKSDPTVEGAVQVHTGPR